MFEQNNVGVRLRNPIPECLLAAGYASTVPPDVYQSTIDHLLATTQRIVSVIDGENECAVTGEDEWEDMSDDDEGEDEDEGEEEDEGEDEDEGEEEGEGEEAPTDINEIKLQSASGLILEEIISTTGEENLYPPLDGTSFYTTICRINHSCVPNVMVRYSLVPAIGLCAEMVALRDLEENEELVQSYIDNTLRKCAIDLLTDCDTVLGTEERQALLRDYGFTCHCSLCQQEKALQEEQQRERERAQQQPSSESFVYCAPCL
jgi:hypothetical protein